VSRDGHSLSNTLIVVWWPLCSIVVASPGNPFLLVGTNLEVRTCALRGD